MTKKSKTPHYDYKFSFVMPIYNVGDYLAETIESVIAQSMAFKPNIELILVNDGSTDASEEVCKRYQKKYPNNVQYIKQANKGVSAARNAGLKHVHGKYVSFLDPDDLLSPDTLDNVYRFFEAHYDEIDFVSIKIEFFEGRTGEHGLNYKFHTTRIIDTRKEYDAIQLSGASSFIKADVFKKNYQFDTKLKYTEDAKLLTDILLDKQKYGVLSKPTYYYRRRFGSNSAIDSSRHSAEWYTEHLERAYEIMITQSKQKIGHVSRYIQALIIYDIGGRFYQDIKLIPPEVDQLVYKEKLFKLASYVEDEVILNEKNLGRKYKLMLIAKRHGIDILRDTTIKNGRVYFNKLNIYNIPKKTKAVIEFIKVKNETVQFEGYISGYMFHGMTIEAVIGSKSYDVDYCAYSDGVSYSFGEKISELTGFSSSLPIEDAKNIRFYAKLNNKRYRIGITYKKYSGIANQKWAYVEKNNYLFYNGDSKELSIEPKTRINTLIRELRYQSTLKKLKKYRIMKDRIVYYATKPKVSADKTWLISDRIDAAGDNGEALFRYLQKYKPKKVKTYFAIDKESKDYVRMSTYGDVVDRNSQQYNKIFLHADKIISSHADHFITNPFNDNEPYYRGLLKFDFVFLQHGVIHNDLSVWLNRHKKNIRIFVSSTKSEYKALIGKSYGYTPREVKMTGLPRYDLLVNRPKNKLMIAPTWRHTLAKKVDKKNNLRHYNNDFKDSEFFIFYSRLISDSRLLEALKSSNMVCEFYLHPAFSSQIRDFMENKFTRIMQAPFNYNRMFREGNILVTDYSSVAFDFAYLKKPVIYAQYDKDVFYQSTVLDPGYFSYEKNGFGRVTYDYESTIKTILETIEAGCVLESKYEMRINNFFEKIDKNNSKRVVQAILDVDKVSESYGKN